MFPLKLPHSEPLLTVTHPKSTLWIIELHNGQDNRLTVNLVDNALKPALDAVEKSWREGWRAAQQTKGKEGGKGALIIVGRRDQDKFFSNGLDFESVVPNQNFFPVESLREKEIVTFNPMLTRLILFPIPTIAAINGHCFAGGFMLSLACDYRVMTDGSKRNAWLCMNEVHFGAVWPLSFAAILRAKIGDHRLHRKIALEGHRFTPSEALTDGLVDHLVKGGTAEILAKAEEVADTFSSNARAGVWGMIKADLYRDSLDTIKKDLRIVNAFTEDAAAKSRL